MDKIEVEEIKSTREHHKFYCDDCGEFLMESTEHSDGYYITPKEFRVGYMELDGHYCRKCGNKRCQELIDFAKSKGFDVINYEKVNYND